MEPSSGAQGAEAEATSLKPSDLGIGLLFWAIQEAVIVADVETERIVLWNPAAEAMFGYTHEEAVGLPVDIVAPDRLKPMHRAGIARYRETGHGQLIDAGKPVELPAVRRDGSEFVVELSLGHMEARPGGKRYVLAVIRDASARRRGEDELRRREASFKALADNTPDTILRWDRAYRHVYVNPAVEHSSGLKPEALIGKTHAEAGAPPERAALMEGHIRQVFETGEPHEVELTSTRGDKYFNVRFVPERGPDGATDFVLGVARDITARRQQELVLERANRELADQSHMLGQIVANAPVVIAYVDRDLVYRWNNPRHAATTGVPADRIIGRRVAEVLPPEFWGKVEPAYRRVLETGEPAFALGAAARFDRDHPERVTYWDSSYIPIPGRDGLPGGILVLAVETTERVERERLQAEKIAALEQADQLKDEFLSILSHELRTPLNAVLGFASILDDELQGPLNAQQHHDVGRILASGEALLNLVNDLLDMGRIQAGKFTLSPERCAFEHLVREALASIRPLAEQKGQHLLDETPAGLPTLRADEQRVLQVLLNLVGNAVKFTPEGGTIRVSSRVDGRFLRCEVADNGPGIPHADQARLFKPFSQLDMSNTRPQGGTGLGLSIAKALVEAHGGAIGVTSEPGHGCIFWFTLPLGRA